MTGMSGKVALVTGASSGIGHATAELFAAKGCKVVLAARREEEMAALADAIASRGGQATAIRVDVSIAVDVEKMVAHAMETYGRLDFAVNCAGIEGKNYPIGETPEDEWDQVLDINLKGTFLCLKYESRAMLAGSHGGAIVNVGSINSFLGYPTFSAYCASKHGLIGLTSSVSAELAPHGIRVNLICPGLTDTPMHRRARKLFGDEPYDEFLGHRIHMRRAGLPAEIARSIVFLCSEDASYITGTTLTPDGGLHLTL